MPIDIEKLAQAHQGKQFDLFAQYCNPQLVKVLRTIGFDRDYVRAEGPYLYDTAGNACSYGMRCHFGNRLV